MLFAAFKALLEEKGFEAISVQDIAERSTVNRATFYDHFTDKFALLDAMIGDDFRNVMRSRLAHADGSCRTGIRQLVLAVCDYLAPLASAPCQKARKQFEPMVEARLKTMLSGFLDEIEAIWERGRDLDRKSFAIANKDHPLFGLAMQRYLGKEVTLLDWYGRSRLKDDFSLRPLVDETLIDALDG